MLLFTFMIAAGALTGEAFFGVESAILAVSDELGTEQEYHPDSWREDTYLDEMFGIEADDFSFVIDYAMMRNIEDFIDENGDGISDRKPPCSFGDDFNSIVCTETMSIKSWWPQARFAGFLLVNVALAAIIFVLFRAAGIIGVEPDSEGDSEVMDAEMAD